MPPVEENAIQVAAVADWEIEGRTLAREVLLTTMLSFTSRVEGDADRLQPLSAEGAAAAIHCHTLAVFWQCGQVVEKKPNQHHFAPAIAGQQKYPLSAGDGNGEFGRHLRCAAVCQSDRSKQDNCAEFFLSFSGPDFFPPSKIRNLLPQRRFFLQFRRCLLGEALLRHDHTLAIY